MQSTFLQMSVPNYHISHVIERLFLHSNLREINFKKIITFIGNFACCAQPLASLQLQSGIAVASRVGGARVGCRAGTEASLAKDAAARAWSGAKLLLLLPLSAPSPRINADSAESPLAVCSVACVYLPHPWRVL